MSVHGVKSQSENTTTHEVKVAFFSNIEGNQRHLVPDALKGVSTSRPVGAWVALHESALASPLPLACAELHTCRFLPQGQPAHWRCLRLAELASNQCNIGFEFCLPTFGKVEMRKENIFASWARNCPGPCVFCTFAFIVAIAHNNQQSTRNSFTHVTSFYRTKVNLFLLHNHIG